MHVASSSCIMGSTILTVEPATGGPLYLGHLRALTTCGAILAAFLLCGCDTGVTPATPTSISTSIPVATPTPTLTPTPTPSATPTSTPTNTSTNTPTSTSIPTPFPTPVTGPS